MNFKWVGSAVICSIIIFSPSSVIAQESVVFTDDFSQGLNKWEEVEKLSGWQATPDQTARVDSRHSNHTYTLRPKETKAWQTAVIEYQASFYAGLTPQQRFLVDYQDQRNHLAVLFVGLDTLYVARIHHDTPQWERVVRGAYLVYGTWSDVAIRLEDTRLTVILDGNEIFSDVDPFLDKQKYGSLALQQHGFGTSIVDAISITTELADSDTDAGLILPEAFKQDDPQWALEEYDFASSWSLNSPTIQRWGCALVSVASLLRYYGYDQLPTGEALTPSSLNVWLQLQPDGFIGAGLVNWIAITRLTAQRARQTSQPSLEVSFSELDFMKLEQQLKLYQPVIADVGGHFVLITDLDEQYAHILDPLYEREHISLSEIKSLRIFEPSYTDLSYLVIGFNDQLAISEPTKSLQRISEYIQAPDGISGTTYSFYTMAKPQHLDVLLNIANTSSTPSKLVIWEYDIQGNLTDRSQVIESSSEHMLQISKSEPSQPVQLKYASSSSTQLADLLAEHAHRIPLFVQDRLNRQLAYVVTADERFKPNYYQVLLDTYAWYQPFIAWELRDSLQTRIESNAP